MKNKVIQGGKQIILILLVYCLLSGSIPAVSAKNLPHGWAGEGVAWQYNPSAKTLSFAGKGQMEDLLKDGFLADTEYDQYKKKVKTVVFKEGVVAVGVGCCYGMSNLTEVKFSKSIKEIDEAAFQHCVKLKKVKLPPNLKKIGYHAFYDTAITQIKFPGKLEKMEGEVVKEGQLKTFNIPKSLKEIPSGLYSGNKKLTSYKIPDHIESIGSGAFSRCKNLKSITLNKKLKTIGSLAFSECKNLETVTCNKELEKIEEYAFSGCKNLKTVTCNKELRKIGDFTFSYCEKMVSIKLSSQLQEIGNYAFKNCGRLVSIEVPDTVKLIGCDAFYRCKRLKTVKLPDDIEKIRPELFLGSGIEHITIPSKVEEISYLPFAKCNDLKEIHIKSLDIKRLCHTFEGIPSDCVIYVPTAKVEEYREMFQKSGLDPAIQIIGE